MAYRDKDRNGLTTVTTLTTPGGVIGKLLSASRRSRPAPEAPGTVSEVSDAGTSPPRTLPTTDEILVMSYREFAKADLVITIRSALLGDDVQLASRGKAARRASRDHVVFLLDEFRHLYVTGRLDVEAVQALYRLKKLLGKAWMRGCITADGARSGDVGGRSRPAANRRLRSARRGRSR